ncbi:hypothetical protein [Afipia sp. GAS231]|uniref:hypothetical protein n=1 Tax=Afipia sp. GAS231 TaxID=1882747 RepID=UPI0012FA55ED|nr:hypothetical protein [Afipia sp. GAS231]
MGIAALHPSYEIEYGFAFSRHDLPGVLQENLAPENQRAQGRPGARRTRGLVRGGCNKDLRTSIQVWRRHPAFPAQWLYGLYDFVLVTGFLATIIRFGFRFRRLDASTGASDPNDFAVRNSPFVSRAAASTAPCPSFATMADAPCVQKIWQNERTGGCGPTARCWN